MFKNLRGQYFDVYAFYVDGGLPYRGGAATITAYLSKDGTMSSTQIVDTNPAEVDSANQAGVYRFALTEGESNCDLLTAYPISSTSGVRLNIITMHTIDLDLVYPRIWRVDKATGSDSYNGRQRDKAVATINEAVDRAANGDRILILPETYSESVDLAAAAKALTILGVNRETCIISSAAAHAINMGHDCHIGNLTVTAKSVTTGQGAAFECLTKHGWSINNVNVNGKEDSIATLNCRNFRINNVKGTATWDSLLLRGAYGYVVENSQFFTDGSHASTSSGTAIYIAQFGGDTFPHGIIRNCSAIANATGANSATGIICKGVTQLENIYAEASVNTAGQTARGIDFADEVVNRVTLMQGGSIYVSASAGTAYSIDHHTDILSRLLVIGTNYDKTLTRGIIEDVPVNFRLTSIDTNGRVDISKIEGADATDQINAAADTALADYDPPTKTELDSAIATVTAKTNLIPASPAAVGSAMTLADDAITASKFDESSAFPLKLVDTGATRVARAGADSDTLETLSDQMDGLTVTVTGSVITIREPVVDNQTVEIVQGDDYLDANNQALEWLITGYDGPSLTAATVSFAVMTRADYLANMGEPVLTTTGAVSVNGTTVTITVDLTSAQTAALTPTPYTTGEQKYGYVYMLRVTTSGGHKSVKVLGNMRVSKEII
jgi:hypothetical protein